MGRTSNFRLQPDCDHLQVVGSCEPVNEFDVLAVALDQTGHVGNAGPVFIGDFEVVVRCGAGRIEVQLLDA
jgi:hypothetical protein